MRKSRTAFSALPLQSLDNTLIRQRCLSSDHRQQYRRYPARLLRYWFMHQLLQEEWQHRGPLAVCEFGVDRGQMLSFAREAAAQENGGQQPAWLQTWDAVDVRLQESELHAAGYERLVALNLETDALPADMRCRYDVIILLHVLEHLQDPEAVLDRVTDALKPGGIIIGGMPVLPHALLGWREGILRRKAATHGHVSAFSPQRMRTWAQRFGLHEEFCCGGFFLRSKRLWLEDQQWWIRLNLRFGARCPWWPGEFYWSFRRPLQQ